MKEGPSYTMVILSRIQFSLSFAGNAAHIQFLPTETQLLEEEALNPRCTFNRSKSSPRFPPVSSHF